MTERLLPVPTPVASACTSVRRLGCRTEVPLLELMLVVIVVGFPLLAWLADLALLDSAAMRAWIEALVRDTEDRR